jgi:hypothetical protein
LWTLFDVNQFCHTWLQTDKPNKYVVDKDGVINSDTIRDECFSPNVTLKNARKEIFALCESNKNSLENSKWELWYQDTFDQEGGRKKVREGNGLLDGLALLWARHLYDVVRPNDMIGFSQYNLWWKQRKFSIAVVGKMPGQEKLRRWVFEERRVDYSSYLQIADREILEIIAEAHYKLIMNNQSSELIINTAISSNNREEFIFRISTL